METLKSLLKLYTEASFIHPVLKEIFELLFGIALISALLAFIAKSFPTRESISIARFLQGLMLNMFRGMSQSLEDPIEHRGLTHAKHIGNIAFGCSGFLIFLVWGLIFLVLAALNFENIQGLKSLLVAGLIALLFFFAMFFKAETGRAIVAYRNWRNNA